MTKEIEQLRQEIEQHVRNAYALLPSEITPPNHLDRKHLESKFEHGEWQQVCGLIRYWSRNNNFALGLLEENAAAYEKIRQLSCLIFQEKLLKISVKETQLIGECLNAIANGPFLPDWEFQTLTGLERKEVAIIAKRWPDFDKHNDAVLLAVSNSMNHLHGYPHHKESELSKYLSVSEEQLREFSDKWFESRRTSID